MVDTDFPHEWTERVAVVQQLTEAACNRLQNYFPQWDVQLETPTENPATAILNKASAWPSDLIVVGTHGRSGIARVVLGSVSLRLVREAVCSVRVARPRRHDGPIRLLVGNDGSYEAEAAINEVCRRSWPAGTEARVLAVHEMLVAANAERIAIGDCLYDQINEDEHFRLKHIVKEAAEKLHHAGFEVSPIVEEGDPKEALVREARNWNADTMFIGARGLGLVERFVLGSVSSATVARAPCTVEVVRHR
jgi:nucleotide-binding universal stress UspA family protein